MKVRIDIDTATFIRFGLVTIGFVLVLLAVWTARTPLTLIGVSLFLALALNPPVNSIAKRLPSRSRVGATALAYVLVIGFLSGLIVTIVPPVVEQSSKFAETVPRLIDNVSDNRVVFDTYVERYGLEAQVDQAVEDAKSQAASVASNIGNLLVSSVAALINGAINLLIVLVLTFLMLIEGPGWLKRAWGLYHDPEKLKRHQNIVRRMYQVVTGFVNGQLLVALIAAACTLATVLILSAVFPLPANLALPIATIVFLTSLLPMIGATLGAILGTLILLLNDPGAAIVFLIYFIVYQQIENNFISPTVQSKTVDLSALTVLGAIIIGFTLFGFLGGIISIPIAGCIRVLLSDHLEHTKKIRSERSSHNPLKRLIGKAKES